MRRPAASGLLFHAPRVSAVVVLGAAACALGLFAAAASAQVPPAATAPAPAAAPAPAVSAPKPPANSASATKGRTPAKAVLAGKNNGRSSSSPSWRELRPAEQQALAPLAGSWDRLSLAQRRKWRALSRNFSKLSPDEQAKLHSRMTEWVALSPQQRTQARLNFGVARQVPADEKKAKWQAYQALSPEEKRKLAAAAARPPATAAAIRPVAPGKLATVPRAKTPGSAPRRGIVAPGRLDRHTLLPRRLPASAAAAPATGLARPAAPPVSPAPAAPPASPASAAPADAKLPAAAAPVPVPAAIPPAALPSAPAKAG